MTTRRIVVFRAGGLGDVLLTQPALRALHSHCPGAWIQAVGYPAFWDVMVPLVDEIVSIDSPLFSSLYADTASDALRAWLHEVDLAVAWTSHDPRPALAGAGVPAIIHVSPHPPPGIHAAEWLLRSVFRDKTLDSESAILPATDYLDTSFCRLPSVAPEAEQPAYPLAHPLPEAEQPACPSARLLSGAAVLHPGAGGAWKRWPAERFADLGTELVHRGHRVVLVEGPADREVVAEVQRLSPHKVPVVRAPTVGQLYSLLCESSIFVGNDSGVTHLATAAGVPTIALFGPTDPANWAPLGITRVIRACRAVAREQGQIRVCEDPRCMEGITVDDVVRELAALDLLSNA